METSRFASALHRITEWIMRLAYLNLIWIIFTVLGLGIFTILPATAAVYGVTRKWIIGDEEFPVFRTFWNVFRQEFWRSQILGVIFIVSGVVLYVDYLIFASGSTILTIALKYITFIMIFFYASIWVFLFPVLVHYDMKLLEAFKTIFFLGVLRPLQSIFIISLHGILFFIMLKLPGLLPFFGISVPALWITIATQKEFARVSLKYKVNVG